MSEQMAEPDTRERNPKVQMAWGLLAPYIASEDPPDLSDNDQAEILTAGALPQVWEILLDLEAKLEAMEPIYTAASGLAVAIESFEGDDIDEVTRQWLEELLKALAATQKE